MREISHVHVLAHFFEQFTVSHQKTSYIIYLQLSRLHNYIIQEVSSFFNFFTFFNIRSSARYEQFSTYLMVHLVLCLHNSRLT